MNGPRRVRCRRCTPDRSSLVFYHPHLVYCESCNRQVGVTSDPVVMSRAMLKPEECVVVDPDTGEVYATVDWDRDRVAIL